MFRNSTLQIGVQHMKNLRVKRFSQLGSSLLAAGFFAFSAHAAQTVDPRSAPTGGTNFNGTTQTFASNGSFTFYGTYSDASGSPESGLGLKLKYDATKINVALSEEYSKCRIAAAQNQVNGATSQWVMGWIDTSVRASGAVGWPDLADTNAGGANPTCLNPVVTPPSTLLNNEFAAGSAAGLKLFKAVVTWVGSPTLGATALISLDDEGNFSYANASPTFDDKSFTVQAGAAASCNLNADGNVLPLDPFIDGVLILRYMLGVGNATYTAGAIPQAPRNTAQLVKDFLATQNLSVVGNAGLTPDAFVDGVVILRLMLGVGNATLLNGLPADPSLPAGTPVGINRTATAANIRSQVNTRCGTSF